MPNCACGYTNGINGSHGGNNRNSMRGGGALGGYILNDPNTQINNVIGGIDRVRCAVIDGEAGSIIIYKIH